MIYFRCGYAPDQYMSADGCEWDARLMMERSKAIKCPSISYHLAGTKKVQQVLADPGNLERIFDDPDKVARLRDVFTGLYSLDLVVIHLALSSGILSSLYTFLRTKKVIALLKWPSRILISTS